MKSKKFVKDQSPSYLLKITLRDIKPPIWRRFIVPASITLEELHYIVLSVMGWCGGHLHSFRVGGNEYMPASACEYGADGLPEAKYILAEVAQRKGTKLRYEYDFGDGWDHEIVVENVDYSNPDWAYPICCIDGARACPPEDCGGVYGYENLCEAMADKKHPEHKELVEWLGGVYDPNSWDIDKVNAVFGIKPQKTAKKAVKKAVKKTTTKKAAKK